MYSQSDISAQAIHDYEECLKKAAEQDDHLAQYLLAECYINGQYIERDYDKALRLGRNISRAAYWFSVAGASSRIHDMMSHIRYC